MTEQNEQSDLINEYIKNLAAKVNELQAENILLKTRLMFFNSLYLLRARDKSFNHISPVSGFQMLF